MKPSNETVQQFMLIRMSFRSLAFVSYVLFMYFGRVLTEITPYVTTETKNCLPYGLQNTNNGTNSYCICSFNACPGDLITVTACGCSGSVILSLVNQTSLNLDRLYPLPNQLSTCQNFCPGFSFYIEDVKCRTFAIREGCLNAGSCSAALTVSTSSSNSSNSATRRLITTDYISASSGSESDTCNGLGATYIVVSIIVLLLIPLCIIGACIFCFIGCFCPEKACCTRSPSSVVPMAAVEHVQGTPTFIVHTLPQQQQAQQQQPQQNKIYYGGVDQASVVVYERLDMELGNMSQQSVPIVEAQQVFY